MRDLAGDRLDVFSAGSKPAGYVHPLAIEALAEIGIDISGHHSKHLDQYLDAGIDTVITVCDHANESCPVFPGPTRVVHRGFDDPPRLARDAVFAEVYAHDFSTVDSSLYHRIIITRPWKLILTDPAYDPDRGPELYNLDVDPFEWENQAETHPDIVEALEAKIESWWN